MTKPAAVKDKFESFQYIKLVSVSEALKISMETLLQFGTQGKLKIIAPVVAAGQYAWPGNRKAPMGSVMHLSEFWIDFGPGDRILLSSYDVASIEGVGWTIPKYIFTPERTKKMLDNMENRKPSGLDLRKKELGMVAIDKYSDWENCPWVMLNDANKETPKTTIDNLFLSRDEFDRLKRGGSGFGEVVNVLGVDAEPEKPHRNSVRYSSEREKIYSAAVYCLMLDSKEADNAADLARKIEKSIYKFWPDKDPLAFGTIEKYLRKAIGGEFIDKDRLENGLDD
jgi:hypothetical protein